MIILGLVLLVAGLVTHLYVLWIVGLVLVIVGALWWALSLGATPRVHSRYHYW